MIMIRLIILILAIIIIAIIIMSQAIFSSKSRFPHWKYQYSQRADNLLFSHKKESETADEFVSTAFPPRFSVLAALMAPGWVLCGEQAKW